MRQYIGSDVFPLRCLPRARASAAIRWIFGGIKYTNSVEAELTPQNESKVTVQFKKFNLFGGIFSFTAPDRARGELGRD